MRRVASATSEGGPRNPLFMEKELLRGSSKPSKKCFLHCLLHRAHPISLLTPRKEKRHSSREQNQSSLSACEDTWLVPAGWGAGDRAATGHRVFVWSRWHWRRWAAWAEITWFRSWASQLVNGLWLLLSFWTFVTFVYMSIHAQFISKSSRLQEGEFASFKLILLLFKLLEVWQSEVEFSSILGDKGLQSPFRRSIFCQKLNPSYK